jgi:hypothetical protein
MADNVAGFNHLDSILLELGNQFRADAMRKLEMENKQKIAGMKMGHTGLFDNNKDISTLQRQAGMLRLKHDDFIREHTQKDMMGNYIQSPQDAEQLWQQTPEAGLEDEVNGAVMKMITNKGIMKPSNGGGSSLSKPTAKPTSFGGGGLDPFGITQ